MLAGCYLIHGGEPLQTDEIITQIKHIAAKEGYNSNMVFEVTTQFDWDELLNKCQTMDLFAERAVVELRLHSDTISKQGSQVLQSLLQAQNRDICVVIRSPKLKAQTLNSAWVAHIQKFGKIEQAKPITADKFPAWLRQRLQAAGFTVANDCLDFLARNYQGNLHAANQCINKFKTLLPSGKLELEQIRPYLDNFSHYSVFDLTDAAIAGDAKRTFHIFNSLKDDNVDPVLILWSLTREVRHLIQIKHDLDNGLNLIQSAQQQGIWREKIPNVKTALNRLSAPKLQQILKLAKQIDTTIKGITPGNSWDCLLLVCMMLSGGEILTMEDLNI